MSKIRAFVKDVIASVVKHYILMIIPPLWTLLIVYIGRIYEAVKKAVLLDTEAYSIIAGLVVVIAVLTFFLTRFYIRRNKTFDFKFRLMLLSVELEFASREKIHYRLKFHLKATDKVDSFKIGINWTGSSITRMPEFTYNPRDCGLEPAAGRGGSRKENEYRNNKEPQGGRECESEKFYNVCFDPPLYKGNEVCFGIQYECSDDRREMDPHLAYKIKWPTKRLIMRVITVENMLSNVGRSVYVEDNNDMPLESILPSSPVMEGPHIVYQWDVKNPYQFFFYRFDWKFRDKYSNK